MNVTVDVFSTTAVAAAGVSCIGSWPGAEAVSHTVALGAGTTAVTVSIPATQTKVLHYN